MDTVLITGGSGKIASYFIKNCHKDFQIRAVDVRTDSVHFPKSVEMIEADLENYNACIKVCQGVHTIVHLAGIVDPFSESDKILDVNITTTRNLFKAAVDCNCKKLIFASSAQVIESYPEDVQATTGILVRPKNVYGVSKCFGEALGAYYAYNKHINVICLRIGAYEFPEDHTEMSKRDLSAFLHPDDFNHLLRLCIAENNLKYEVFNAISDNRYKRLDITETIAKLGYAPKADAFKLFRSEV
ncbi:NAD-dependent epimerase/dehydratase family protein [Flagellimonas olearia]|uniref:NAD-dependent epimerase/dehydratase family protein n=1 Tax=Flagellimonas olearia TaxID=552546 RepID=A0A6I1DY52_9FLAO|nr:NAD(P)-dependent oxidoreductase [Allomuricauda olearia]KAB7530373.1 NAD-dependent epimerase/dehydratase family protein [Allomuricauda olearia]